MSETHTIMDGSVRIYRRKNSRFWQCYVRLGGNSYRESTRQESLPYAIEFAREWFLDRAAEDRLRRRGIEPPPAPAPLPAPSRRLAVGKTFAEAAAAFLREYEALTKGERHPKHVASKERVIRRQLNPFFGELGISEVTAGKIQEFRIMRMEPPPKLPPRRFRFKDKDRIGRPLPWRKPSRSSLNKEIIVLRQVLKMANRNGWIAGLPDMSAPYRGSGKVSHRAWFSPQEFQTFFEAVEVRAATPKRDRWRGECETFRDYVAFMVSTGLRPDEASRLEYRDVSVVVDRDTRERILEIEVRGKRGVGFCKSMPDAVEPFLRMKERNTPKLGDLIFGKVQRQLMNAILAELGLKEDREGNARTAYSLRHTYICFRLLEGADIYQLAKNCRTSVEMIEKFYAAHLKNSVDASAINVRKAQPRARGRPRSSSAGE